MLLPTLLVLPLLSGTPFLPPSRDILPNNDFARKDERIDRYFETFNCINRCFGEEPQTIEEGFSHYIGREVYDFNEDRENEAFGFSFAGPARGLYTMMLYTFGDLGVSVEAPGWSKTITIPSEMYGNETNMADCVQQHCFQRSGDGSPSRCSGEALAYGRISSGQRDPYTKWVSLHDHNCANKVIVVTVSEGHYFTPADGALKWNVSMRNEAVTITKYTTTEAVTEVTKQESEEHLTTVEMESGERGDDEDDDEKHDEAFFAKLNKIGEDSACAYMCIRNGPEEKVLRASVFSDSMADRATLTPIAHRAFVHETGTWFTRTTFEGRSPSGGEQFHLSVIDRNSETNVSFKEYDDPYNIIIEFPVYMESVANCLSKCYSDAVREGDLIIPGEYDALVMKCRERDQEMETYPFVLLDFTADHEGHMFTFAKPDLEKGCNASTSLIVRYPELVIAYTRHASEEFTIQGEYAVSEMRESRKSKLFEAIKN